MRVLTLKSVGFGGVAFQDVPMPQPSEGEVLVRLKAASLNHRELWIIRGQYPGMKLPTQLGADGAGVIEAVGPGVDTARIGDEVTIYPGLNWGDDPRYPSRQYGLLGLPGPGTIAQAICVQSDCALPKPLHLSFVQAAALPVAAITAWRGLTTKAALRAAETLLAPGVGGGVAGFALSFGKAMSAVVYVTSGSDVTLEKAIAAGAAGGFNYREKGWGQGLRRASGGIDVVLDGSPAVSFPEYARALKMGGRVVLYGATGGNDVTLQAPALFLSNVTIIGTNMGSLTEFAEMLRFIERHRIEPAIDKVFDFDAAIDALHHLDSAHGFGKVVIQID